LWQDSGFMQDSFFGDGARELGPPNSGFGSLRSTISPHDEFSSVPDNLGGVVVDSLHGPLRH
jgi:hypothetical protein